jgi:hypothetical protein
MPRPHKEKNVLLSSAKSEKTQAQTKKQEHPVSLQAPQPTPAPPVKTGGPPESWEHWKLYNAVVKTLYALPDGFKTSLRISDFRATDIFTLNSALGASIEDAVVKGLNRLRDIWDADGKYAEYSFERQAQAFPDVRLVKTIGAVSSAPIMGIELKGWFALAKEGEPTFRYVITPNACAPADLLVVYPWALSDVISGTPKLLRPSVEEAKYAAELRNHYWQYKRKGGTPGSVIPAKYQQPYPALKTDQCSDSAAQDQGGNFGRVARYGLLDDFVLMTMKQELSGIPIRAWQIFFRTISEDGNSLETIERRLISALANYAANDRVAELALADSFRRIASILDNKREHITPEKQKR